MLSIFQTFLLQFMFLSVFVVYVRFFKKRLKFLVVWVQQQVACHKLISNEIANNYRKLFSTLI
jgi:hypothetical protein